MNPYQIVKDFEKIVAEYTGAPYAIAVNSCTNALFLSLEYLKRNHPYNWSHDKIITIPSRTYVSVPCTIIQTGYRVKFEDIKWKGIYQLKPLHVYDAAKRFTKNMFVSQSNSLIDRPPCGIPMSGDTPYIYMCLSFHGRKILNIGEGGMILTNDPHADYWFRLARFSGRHEIPYSQDTFEIIGWKMNMSPEQAARGLVLMNFIKDINPDQDEVYSDLSKYPMYERGTD